MTIWFILLGLIAIVASFLILTSVKDRKKAKQLKQNEIIREENAINARPNISNWLKILINKNNKILKDFVPSIGKYKMSEIKGYALKGILELKKTRAFKDLRMAKGNEDLLELIEKFEKTPSNLWANKMGKEIKSLDKDTQNNASEFEIFKKKAKEKINEIYSK